MTPGSLNVLEVHRCRGCGELPVAQVYTEKGKPTSVAILCPTGCATGADTFTVKCVVETADRSRELEDT